MEEERMRSRKSTIGRSLKWGLRRAVARVLPPRWAAAIAARWFTTPETMALAVRDDAHDSFVIRAGGRRLAAWSWGFGPPVVLAHGWNGRGLQLAAVARAIAARGYRAVVFDQPAHGASSGRRTTIPEMADAIAAVCRAVGAQALVAHSLGATAATLAMARGLVLTRAAFIAPPVRPEHWVERFARLIGLPERAYVGFRTAIERRAGAAVAALDPLVLAPAMTADLLVVHDRDDREVRLEAGVALANAWPDARLIATEGLGHTRILTEPSVVDAVAAFTAREPVLGLRDRHLSEIVERAAAAL